MDELTTAFYSGAGVDPQSATSGEPNDPLAAAFFRGAGLTETPRRPTSARRATVPGAKPAALRGPVEELASALGAGVVATMEGIGGTAEMIGIPGGKTAREEWQRIGQTDALRRPEYLQEGTVLDHPERLADWRWWVRSLGENAPNMAAMMLPGVAAYRWAQAANWGAKAIRAAGLAGSWSGSMTLEAGGAYGQAKDEMTQAGVYDADTIEKIATMEGLTAGTVNSIIELLPFDNLFLKQAGADRFLKRVIRQTFWEGSTESAQEAVNVYVEKLGHKPDQQFSDNIGRILESGIIGGALGGMAGGSIGTVEHRRNVRHYNALGEQLGLKEMAFKLKEAGADDKEIAKQVDARLGEIRAQMEAAPAAEPLTGGGGVKDVAKKEPLPDIDAAEMVSYLLYGDGAYGAPAGKIEKAATRAKKGVLGVFGMKEKVAPPEKEAAPDAGTDTLTSGTQAGKDIAQAEPLAKKNAEEKKAAARKKGATLFDNVMGELNQEDQARMEAARQQELLAREEKDQQAAAEVEAAAKITAGQAILENGAVVKAVAGDHPQKQALAAEVMGLSDRVVLSAVQSELGINVQPAGQDRYEIVTAEGAQPVPILSLRKMLAEKRVADFDAAQIAEAGAEKQRLADLATTQKRTEDARIKKEKEIAAQAFANTREELRMRRTLSPQQYALLQAERPQLTPQEIALLDAGPAVAGATPPQSLKALGVRGKPATAVPSQSEAAQRVKQPWEMTLDEFKMFTEQKPGKIAGRDVAGTADFRMGKNPAPSLIAHEWIHTNKDFLAIDYDRLESAFAKDAKLDWWSKGEDADEALANTYGWLHGGSADMAAKSPELLKIAKELPKPPTTIAELHQRIIAATGKTAVPRSLAMQGVKEKKAAPKSEPVERLIGKNADGEDLYEDENGIRYTTEKGVKVFENVAMVPTRGGIEKRPATPRDPRYELAQEKETPPADKFKIGNIVRPKAGSGIGAYAAGRIQHISYYQDGGVGIKTENTGNMHFKAEDWELVEPDKTQGKAAPKTGDVLSSDEFDALTGDVLAEMETPAAPAAERETVKPKGGFAPEILVQGTWSRNGLIFPTEQEAAGWASQKMSSWMMAEDSRVVPVSETPNWSFKDGELKEIKPPEPKTAPSQGVTAAIGRPATPKAETPSAGKAAQFVTGDKVIVQHGGKTFPATVQTAGEHWASVAPTLSVQQAKDLGLGSTMQVSVDQLKPAASLGKAASEVAAGVASSYDAIAEILKKAGKGPISMMGGGVFDEELYNAIKPHLQATYNHFRAAAIEVKEWMKETVSQFAARGFDSHAIIPYIKRFYMEVTAETPQLTYEQFATQYRDAFEKSNRYTPEQVGFGQYGRTMAKLADDYPSYLDRFEAEEETRAGEPDIKPFTSVAANVQNAIGKKQPITWQQLGDWADAAFGGTMAEGKYTIKDAYDAMEMGVNLYIDDSLILDPTEDLKYAKDVVEDLQKMVDTLLPTQTRRTAEMDEFQQFSTPPALAYIANWAANLNTDDVYLEPSAGTGDLAVFAKNAKVKETIVNEIAPRRVAILRWLGFDRVFTENGEQLHNILPAEIVPTVIVMNPPFSSTAGRKEGARDTREGMKHIDQALRRLAPGGRLVAILGESISSPSHKAWWTGIENENAVRANIGINGKNYAKYGTNFDNRIIIIDKIKPGDYTKITGRVEELTELLPLIEGVRNDRQEATRTGREGQPASDKQAGAETPPAGKVPSRSGIPARPATDIGTTGERGGVGVGSASGTTGQPLSSLEPGGRGEVSATRPNQAEFGIGNTGSELPGSVAQQNDRNRSGLPAGESAALTAVNQAEQPQEAFTGSIYENYRPEKVTIAGAKPHPAKLVQSASMAGTPPPAAQYQPNLPKNIIETGKLSDAQLEAIIYAGQAHQEHLDTGERKGFFIGDGTGVGKGREIAGIIYDNWNQGRKKALWISEKFSLAKDAKRDIEGIGWLAAPLISKTEAGDTFNMSKGIMFTTYATLRSKEKKMVEGVDMGKTRLAQITTWLGADFDGVIVFDESHNMGNAVEQRGSRGQKQAAQQALAGLALQAALPQARIVYVSATGATEISNLAYAQRLGLWGPGTAFGDMPRFINSIAQSGLAGMELVARDMKAMGNYISRSLSFEDVTYGRLEHPLTDKQKEIYDQLAVAWQTVLHNVDAALDTTQANAQGKSAAKSAFWGTHLRFFSQIITSMQMPSVIASAKKDIAEGNAVVMQLVSTHASVMDRAMARMEEGDELDDLDLTPRDHLMTYIQDSFPVQQYEEYTDDNGNIQTRKVVDSEGNPVLNADAVRARDELLERLGSISVPDGPLDIVLNQLGANKVAEVTGRGRRVVIDKEGKKVQEKRSRAVADGDADAFMNDKKQILVFSDAGGTGRSYHADNTAVNRRKRVHYLVQPGWRSDKAVQGLGRTHRTNQASAPQYILVTTDLKGQSRFISSIARRLDQLGALTKGQRQTGSQGIFQARDNLESTYAQEALRRFFIDLAHNDIPGMDLATFERETGLKLRKDDGGLRADLPPIRQFLNRLLSMTYAVQNRTFDHFSDRLDAVIRMHEAQGTLDVGLETLRADKVEKVNEQVVYTDEKTGAETKYVELDVSHRTKRFTFQDAEKLAKPFYRNIRSGQVWVVASEARQRTTEGGNVEEYRALRAANYHQQPVNTADLKNTEKWETITPDEAREPWQRLYDKTPIMQTERQHLITGALLPIWDRIDTGHMRIMRVQTAAGEKMVGRLINEEDLTNVLRKLGATRGQVNATPQELVHRIMQGSRIRLSNEWSIAKRRVSGDDRIELIGPDYSDNNELNRAGVFTERISFKTRYFIPTDDQAAGIIEKLTARRPVVSMTKEAGASAAEISEHGAQYALADDMSIELPAQGVVVQDSVPREILREDQDWQGGKKRGDIGAARRFTEKTWTAKKTERLLDILDNPKEEILYISQPSTTRMNVQPMVLAEKLARETDGKAVAGEKHFDPAHEEESKKISRSERVDHPREYVPADVASLRNLAQGRRVVLVEDIFTTGGSAAAFIRALELAGVHVDAHIGYFGEKRLRVDANTVDKLQKALRNANIPVKGMELSKLLTRQETGSIIQDINQARTENAREKLTERLQGILDRGTSGPAETNANYGLVERGAEGQDLGHERSGQGISPVAGTPTRAESRLNSLDTPSITVMVRQWAATMTGIKIRETAAGRLVIETKSGQTVEVTGVKQITPDAISLSIAYGTEELPAGNVIAGQFLSAKVTGKTAEVQLVFDKAGVWTMSHEFYHFLEEIGAISNEDKNLLNRKIRSLTAKDTATYAKLKGMSPAEQRAEWAGRTHAGAYDATTPTGKILQKIRTIIDQVINALGIRTAGGVVRDIRSGEIHETIPGTRRTSATSYATDEAGRAWPGGWNGRPAWATPGTRVQDSRGHVGIVREATPDGIAIEYDRPTTGQDEYIDPYDWPTPPRMKIIFSPTDVRQTAKIRVRNIKKGDGGVQRIVYENGNGAQIGTARLMGSTIGDITVPERARKRGYGRAILEDLRNRGGQSAYPGSDEGKALMQSAGMEETKDGRFQWPEGTQYALADQAERVTTSVAGVAARAGNRGLAMMGAKTSPAIREGATAFAKHWKEFWQPFSTVPDGDKILAKRYEAMGNVGRAVRFIEDLYKKVDAYSDQVKKDMFWYLNGDVPIDVLPEDVRETAEMIRRRTEVIGEMLVDRGIIAEGQFEKYKGKYIHYMYAKHVMGEDKPIFLTSTGKLNLSYTKSRNTKLTTQQRKELGLIEDASVAVPVGMGKALTDIAKWDYLKTISDNAEWVWQPSLIKVPIGRPLATPIRGRTRRNVTMGIGKLIEEAKTYDAMMAKHPTPEIAEIHRILHEALDKAEEASANMPTDFVQLPNSKGYGPLAGAFVRKPIADDLMPVLAGATDRGKLMNTILEIERQGMAGFKMGKVALNFPTAVRNIVSNIIQMNMRGRSLSKIPGDIIIACEAMKARNEYYEEAFGMGLFHTNWFVSEINNVLDEFRKVKGGRIDQILIAVKNVAKYYGKIDDISKLAIFIEQRKAGKSVDEATLEAMKWGMDYSLTSRSVKGLRQTIIPFATYQYKIAPLIAESLKKRPWVLAKYGLIYTIAKAAAMSLHDLGDDDWEDLEKQLPAYIKKSGSMMILPWKSNKGQWQWVNLEYFFPWGNYLAIARDMKAADLGEGLRDAGLSNPFLSMFYTGLSAREDQPPLHSYFGTPIYNQLDTAPMKAAKLLEYMANIWIPSMATRQGAIGYTGRAIAGGEDRWGREVSAGQALGRWFGVNIVSVSPEQTRAQASVRIQDLRKEQSRIEANPSYDEEEKKAYAGRLNEKLAEIAGEAPAAVLPITKAKGKDPVYDALQAMAAKGILHTAPPSRSVEIAGIPLKMTMDQYGRYLEQTSEIARNRLLPLVNSPAWEAMSDKRKSDAVSGIVAHARKGIRQRIKVEIARENQEKIREAKIAGR